MSVFAKPLNENRENLERVKKDNLTTTSNFLK